MSDTGYVYFIETKCGRFVKIGYSVDPYRRMGELGTLRPSVFDVHVLGYIPGTPATERWLHRMFEADRDNGEWFRLSARLEFYINVVGLVTPDLHAAEATSAATTQPTPDHRPQKMSSLGAQELAACRMTKISPARRKEIGRNAATARWAKVRASA